MNKLLAIVGPTATGKTELAINVAKQINAEIVSADSMLVYKELNIGVAKPSRQQRNMIAHHLIDIACFKEAFSAGKYQKLARQAIEDILARHKTPLLTGGTGLYVRAAIDKLNFPKGQTDSEIRKSLEKEALEEGTAKLYCKLKKLDPEAAASIETNNKRRIIRALEVIKTTGKKFSDYQTNWDNYRSIYNTTLVGLSLDRQELYTRINHRVDRMIKDGLIDETKLLLKQSFKTSLTAKQALGYKEILEYLEEKTSLDEAIGVIKKRTRNYAKRQVTWFKKDPRIHWVNIKGKNIKQTTAEIIDLYYKKC
ncbi:MAG: tRNA (adenosine(37)-N6)-dimethylallyltransferase MiaA [Actinobacteria bacterium]|nr:MAG: tRNA (adenosine(37)-N6)-dimethylallyltransferase MiaA [Actinomycetota bacterium]